MKEEAAVPPPQPPSDWTRCHAYNARKKRFCRQLVHPSSAANKYCGNHLHLQGNKRKRIPCPVDPTHYIFEDCLTQHVKKCPKTMQQQQQVEALFYRRNCNCRGHGGAAGASAGVTLPPQDDNATNLDAVPDLRWAKRLALRVLQVHQKVFLQEQQVAIADDNRSSNDLKNLDLATIQSSLPVVDLSQPELDAGLASAVEDFRLKSGGSRHLHQQASLVGHLRRIGALEPLSSKEAEGDTTAQSSSRDPKRESSLSCSSSSSSSQRILEMGAGRGMTGLIVAGVAASSAAAAAAAANSTSTTHLTMIERGSSRSRAEKFLRKIRAFPGSFPTTTPYLACLSKLAWDRIKCDLAHVDMELVCSEMARVSGTNDDCDNNKHETANTARDKQDLVVIAKHLCGVGTDLALKSLEPIKHKISACIMSTCCHGVCCWKDYVGRQYLAEAMVDESSLPYFGDKEFELLRLWSTGTVRDIVVSNNQKSDGADDDNDDDSGAPVEEEEEHSNKSAPCDYHNISDDDRIRNVVRIVEALQLNCGPQGLGRACQRLIDYGRREYLRNVLFSDSKDNVQLLYYVPAEVTPQNALLIAHRYG